MSTKPPGLPRWFWPLLAALCVLGLLLQVLLRHSGGDDGSDGAGRGRVPFPKGGAFSKVRRPSDAEPRGRSAAEPWQDERKGK